MEFRRMDPANAAAFFPELWQEFEQRFHLSLTIHDHIGIFVMPDGSRLLPRHNIHQAACCQYKRGKRLRCYQHCGSGAIIEGEIRRAPFRYQCWRGIVECVLPLFQGKELAATIFAGVFRDPAFPGERLSRYYRQRYLAMPLWTQEKGEEVAFVLTLMGNALMQLASNLRSEYASSEAGRKGRIKRFLALNAGKQVTLEDLAGELDLSPSRTSHVVRQLFGMNFAPLLHREKIRLAKKLLDEGNLSLREVARHCGFQNEFYFSRIFKQLCGMPPGVFRHRKTNQV